MNINETKTHQKGRSLLTVGSYSCYAGVASNPAGLYMFHDRKTTLDDDISPIILDSTAGFYGRGFLHEASGHWIEKTNLLQLPVIPFSEVNFLTSENGQVYYSYGNCILLGGYE